MELPIAAPPPPPTTAPTGPPTTAPPTAPATPPVTAPLESASAAEDDAQIKVAVAAASIHRDIKTSYGFAGICRCDRRAPLVVKRRGRRKVPFPRSDIAKRSRP